MKKETRVWELCACIRVRFFFLCVYEVEFMCRELFSFFFWLVVKTLFVLITSTNDTRTARVNCSKLKPKKEMKKKVIEKVVRVTSVVRLLYECVRAYSARKKDQGRRRRQSECGIAVAVYTRECLATEFGPTLTKQTRKREEKGEVKTSM